MSRPNAPIYDLITAYYTDPITRLKPASRNAYRGALTALFKDRADRFPSDYTPTDLSDALLRLSYSAPRLAQAKAAYRSFAAWARTRGIGSLPELPRERVGHLSSTEPPKEKAPEVDPLPDEVIEAIHDLLASWGEHDSPKLGHLLTLVWADITVSAALTKKKDSLRIPGGDRDSGSWITTPKHPGFAALRTLWRHAAVPGGGMPTGPIIPLRPGSPYAYPLKALRKALAQTSRKLYAGEPTPEVVAMLSGLKVPREPEDVLQADGSGPGNEVRRRSRFDAPLKTGAPPWLLTGADADFTFAPEVQAKIDADAAAAERTARGLKR